MLMSIFQVTDDLLTFGFCIISDKTSNLGIRKVVIKPTQETPTRQPFVITFDSDNIATAAPISGIGSSGGDGYYHHELNAIIGLIRCD